MASQQLQQLNKTRVAKISQETWESYKSDISRLYLDERKTLDQVRLVMEESLGFIATKAQYIRMVNEVWRLKKNIKGSDFDCIDTRERKRARDGKKTGVKLGNRQLDESELRRKRSRHHVSVIEQHQRRVAAQPGEKNIETATPEGMEIFTPTPSIPSPQNTDLVVSGIQDHLFLNSTVSLSKYSPSPGTLVTSLPCPPVPIEEPARLGIALQSASFSLPSSPSNRSMIIASSSSSELPYISFEDPANEGESSDAILLPREFSPDAAQLRVIISSQVREYLHPVALYNNLFHTTPGVGFSLLFENYLKEIFEGSYESLDRAIFANNANHYSTGFELIVDNFAAELLYSAARVGDHAIVDLLLRIGFPGEEASSQRKTLNNKVGTTAIQYAIEYGNIAICYLLLRQGFDVNAPPISDFSPSLLWTAVALDFPDLASDLVNLYNATVEIRKDFDFTVRNSSLLRYTEELICNEKAICARSRVSTSKVMDEYKEKVSDNTNSGLYLITTALWLSIGLKRLKCFSKILPSTFGHKRHELLGTNGLCGLFMVAMAHRSHAVAEYIAEHISLESELANHPRVDSVLQSSIQKIKISRGKLLSKSGVDIHAIHSQGFQDAFTWGPYGYTQCIVPWLQRQGLSEQIRRLDYKENSRNLERPQRENVTLGSGPGLIHGLKPRTISTKKTPDYIYARDVEIDLIFETIEVLVERFCPNDRDLLRNRIIILSALSKCLDIFIILGRDLGVDIFPQNSVHISIRPVDGFQGLSYIKTTSQLFNDVWPTNSSPRNKNSDLRVSWDLGYEPDLEKLKDLFDFDEYDEKSGSIIRYNNETEYLQTGIELQGMASSLERFSRRLWCVNAKCIVEGLVFGVWNFPREDTTNFERVMDLVRWNVPLQYQKWQCALSIEIIPLLTGIGLLSLLRLAVHCDAPETFDLIVGQYWISVGDMHNEVMNFELILLVTIIAGSLYKVINILPFTKTDYDYGRERTPLGVAAFLGRLDICKFLLGSGASKYLSKYENEAGEKGNFAIQTILQMAINERGEAQSGKELTDGVQGLTRLDMP
ncbi:hypothetical protein TWF192_004389 [Orbilia oligospora]|nr:hypothetical protein TWF192_004389 [Orbilia oligospora]